MFYFTQEQLTQNGVLLNQLIGIEMQCTLMLQPTLHECGVIRVTADELQDYMQNIIIAA